MSIKRAKTRPETELSYFDKFKGRTVEFSPKSDEIVATFAQAEQDEAALNSSAAEVTKAVLQAVSRRVNYERAFAVFEVPEAADALEAQLRLDQQAEIANTIPVLVDQEGNPRYILPDELTVQFNSGVSAANAELIIQQQGCEIVVRQRTPGYYTVSVPAGKGLFETIRDFSDLSEVRFAEPSEAGFNDALVYVPDDPDFARLWGLNNTGQTGGSVNSDINACEAWDYQRGSADVVIAVIDTGADLDHPDLFTNLLPRGGEDWNFADAADAIPEDVDGHGTHVCGTAAAVDNLIGVIGVAHNCRLMPLRINLTAGMNQNRADAINYVIAQARAFPNRRYVINGSWRMSGTMTAVEAAIIDAEAANVFLAFAAGNTSLGPVTYPAKYPQTVAVANTRHTDQIDSSSAVGPEVDVCAPGTDIWSTYLNGGYVFLTGTSMSSPHVAGLAALVHF